MDPIERGRTAPQREERELFGETITGEIVIPNRAVEDIGAGQKQYGRFGVDRHVEDMGRFSRVIIEAPREVFVWDLFRFCAIRLESSVNVIQIANAKGVDEQMSRQMIQTWENERLVDTGVAPDIVRITDAGREQIGCDLPPRT